MLHADALGRNDHDRLLRPIFQADRFRRRDSRPAPARRREKMARPRRGRRRFPSAAAAALPFVSRSMPISAAAASLDPPPRPRATGICFSRCTWTPPRKPISRAMALIARYTRFSGPAGNDVSRDVSSDDPGLRHERKFESVVQRDRLKDRAQFVITVRTLPHHVQAQIDFRERAAGAPIFFRFSDGHAGELTAVWRFPQEFSARGAASDSSIALQSR